MASMHVLEQAKQTGPVVRHTRMRHAAARGSLVFAPEAIDVEQEGIRLLERCEERGLRWLSERELRRRGFAESLVAAMLELSAMRAVAERRPSGPTRPWCLKHLGTHLAATSRKRSLDHSRGSGGSRRTEEELASRLRLSPELLRFMAASSSRPLRIEEALLVVRRRLRTRMDVLDLRTLDVPASPSCSPGPASQHSLISPRTPALLFHVTVIAIVHTRHVRLALPRRCARGGRLQATARAGAGSSAIAAPLLLPRRAALPLPLWLVHASGLLACSGTR
jgi:hypothetical protein